MVQTYIMNDHVVIAILLLQVILDAVGDGFRVRGWQKPHHTCEAIREGIWLGLLILTGGQLIDFQIYLVLMYIFGRIWLFDPINNLVSKRAIGYVGESSFDGIIYHWIAGTYRDKHKFPVANVSFIIKFIAILWWIGGLLSEFDKFNLHF